MSKPSCNKIYNDFWKPIIERNGKINMTQLKKELADFKFVMEQVGKVYCQITGGRMSKIFYDADTVLSEADDYQQELFQEWLKDELEQNNAR